MNLDSCLQIYQSIRELPLTEWMDGAEANIVVCLVSQVPGPGHQASLSWVYIITTRYQMLRISNFTTYTLKGIWCFVKVNLIDLQN